MSAAVVIYPASGSITSKSTACQISATGMTANDSALYDNTKYPTEPAINAYFQLTCTGQTSLTSPVFASNSAGVGVWPGSVIFPAAGTWTLNLIRVSDSSTIATASVTVA